MEKIGERRELNKGLGRRKEQCPFSSLSLGWFASFFALTLFPQQESWSQIQKISTATPLAKGGWKKESFFKGKATENSICQIDLYFSQEKNLFKPSGDNYIYFFLLLIKSQHIIVGEFVNLFRIYVWAGHQSFINIKTATLLLKREIRSKII